MRKSLLLATLLCAGSPVFAETTAYGYDVFGRLIGTGQTGGPIDGLSTDTSFDAADNRAAVYTRDVRLTLAAGQSIYSGDHRFQLAMQADGNLVLYMNSTALWSTGTYGTGADRAIFQSDGNLVVYTSTYTPVWVASGGVGAFLALQNDGNLVMYDVSRRATWASNTGGH